MYKHLKEKVYYSELYDKYTIEECKKLEADELSKGDSRRISKYDHPDLYESISSIALYYKKAERASGKNKTIQKWMKGDEEKDKKLTNAKKPGYVRCIECSCNLENCESRELRYRDNDVEDILFTFKCHFCKKIQGFWSNGDRWEYKPICVKCSSSVKSYRSRSGNIITTKNICKQCNHAEIDKIDLSETYNNKVDSDFEKNRRKYCISEQKGSEIMYDTKQTSRFFEKIKKEEQEQKIKKRVKKLTIYEVKEMLGSVIEENGYTKLEFEKPEVKKDLIIGFNLQDTKPNREECDSIHNLQKIFKKELKQTNWKLMSDGVSYKLGYLSGRLRGS